MPSPTADAKYEPLTIEFSHSVYIAMSKQSKVYTLGELPLQSYQPPPPPKGPHKNDRERECVCVCVHADSIYICAAVVYTVFCGSNLFLLLLPDSPMTKLGAYSPQEMSPTRMHIHPPPPPPPPLEALVV